MDSLYLDNVQTEKSIAIQSYNHLRRIAKCFRTIEISLTILFLIYISTHLPFALKLSGEYLRRFSVILTNPISIFLILNILILFLYLKSNQNYNNATPEPQLLDEQLNINKDIDTCTESDTDNYPVFRGTTELVVYQDKEIICEEKQRHSSNKIKEVETTEKEIVEYKRSQSENLRKEFKEKSGKVLRRSKTEDCRKIEDSVEMELSNEEFRRTIEAFLEKQKKFHHLEKLSVIAG